jgi:hypothetical protein
MVKRRGTLIKKSFIKDFLHKKIFPALYAGFRKGEGTLKRGYL